MARGITFPYVSSATDTLFDAEVPPALPGAALDFSAKMSPVGETITTVPNLGSSSLPLVFTTTIPTVAMIEDGVKFWRFTGGAANVSSWVNSAAQTIALRVRIREVLVAETNKTLLGRSSPGGQQVMANVNRFTVHGGRVLDGPDVPPGSGWNSVLVSFAADNSVVDINGEIATGHAGTATVNGFRLAASGASPVVYTQMDVQRVGLIPGLITPAQRAALRAALVTV